MQGMKVDFITNTIVITKAFYEASSERSSAEYSDLNLAKKENPHMRVVLRTNNSTNRRNECKGLTYKYMRKFISVMDSENLITFEKTILHFESYDSDNGTVYQHVKEWFLENYPSHRDMIVESAPKRKVA